MNYVHFYELIVFSYLNGENSGKGRQYVGMSSDSKIILTVPSFNGSGAIMCVENAPAGSQTIVVKRNQLDIAV